MKPTDNIEKAIKKNLNFTAGAELHDRMLDDVLNAQEKSKQTKSALVEPNIRRTIMKSPIMRLATAAVVIAGITLGLFEFIGVDSTSDVWADVVRRVEASRGLILRCTETNSFMPGEGDYSIKYFCPTHSRTDSYKDGLITRSSYSDFETRTFTGLYHTRKQCLIGTIGPSIDGFLEKHEDWTNPGYIVETILSCEHTRLEQRIIEGVLCEGIETTDPAFLGPMPEVDRLEAQLRLWVDVETRYPVLLESKISAEYNGETLDSECVMDQFQWDVDLEPSVFEPNIPPDYYYEDMRSL